MIKSLPIPTVWRIDVEPDHFQPAVGEGPWEGFVDSVARVDKLSDLLEDRTGRVTRPTWLLRMDPDIERCFGRVDFVVRRHAELFDRLMIQQQPMGIHIHYYRWDANRAVAYSDHADSAWTTHCLEVAADAYRNAFGKPARISSQGGYFLTETLLDAAVKLGITLDLTVEPGRAATTTDPSFGAYATAPSPSFINFPRRPYYPSRRDISIPATGAVDCRPLLIVPLTAFDYQTTLAPLHRRIAKRILGKLPMHSPLNPWKKWPSPKIYWDLVARAADEQQFRYIAFAIRTDHPASSSYQNVWDILEYLPSHPIAERLQFIDPLSSGITALANL